MPKTKKSQNIFNHYFELARKNHDNFLFDVFNTALVIFAISISLAFFIWMAKVFSGKILISSVAFYLGNWPIYWYGIIFAVAFLAGLWLITKQAKREKIDPDLLINFVFGTVVCGFFGARIIFVLLSWAYYVQHLSQIFNIWQGGLSLHGALLGGLIFIVVYSLNKKMNYWKIFDLFAPAMLLGQVIGRWGNFFNQELFGYPTNYFLKMYVAVYNRPWTHKNFAYFHPVFLYESILCFLALIILLVLRKKKILRTGDLFLLYLLFYSAIRFVIEFIRIEPKVFIGLTIAQVLSIVKNREH